MNKIFKFSLSVLLIGSVLGGCSDNGSSSTTTTTEARTKPVNVRVKTPDGNVVQGATVAVGDETAQTNASGIAKLMLDPKKESKAHIEKTGYVSQQVLVAASAASDTPTYEAVVAQMKLVGEDVNFNQASRAKPITVTGSAGSKVTISSPNAWELEDEKGNKVTYKGPVDVYITPIDTTNLATLAAFPGGFSGIPESGSSETPIISWGMADYTFKTNDGKELDLANDVDAVIDIPLFQEGANGEFDALGNGDKIPLWHYDYVAKTWKEEGKGIVEAAIVNGENKKVVRATVSHFTPWNIDKAVTNGVTTHISVSCPAGGGPTSAGGQLTLVSSAGGFSQSAYLNTDGVATFNSVPFSNNNDATNENCVSSSTAICDGVLASVSRACFTIPGTDSEHRETVNAMWQ